MTISVEVESCLPHAKFPSLLDPGFALAQRRPTKHSLDWYVATANAAPRRWSIHVPGRSSGSWVIAMPGLPNAFGVSGIVEQSFTTYSCGGSPGITPGSLFTAEANLRTVNTIYCVCTAKIVNEWLLFRDKYSCTAAMSPHRLPAGDPRVRRRAEADEWHFNRVEYLRWRLPRLAC
ncbi:hypothetical protein QBC99_000565 [Beijerinckia sp. GAS462]|nr:hypothetical protein [Beijerinckia sp. GAS462]